MGKGILLFVYGTLKRGFINHRIYIRNSEFIGKGTIKGQLYLKGNIPVLVDGNNDISGEVFIASKTDFEYIRNIETRANYSEEIVSVDLGGKKLDCIVYKYTKEDLKWLGNVKKIDEYGEKFKNIFR